MGLLLGIFTVVLVLISVFMILLVLAQRAKSDGGMGAALGGGMAETVFGAESGNVLTKATQTAAVVFFVLAFGLYLGHIYQARRGAEPQTIDLLSSPSLRPAATPETPATPEGAIVPGVETPAAPASEGVTPPASETPPPASEGATPPAADAGAAPQNEAPSAPANPSP